MRQFADDLNLGDLNFDQRRVFILKPDVNISLWSPKAGDNAIMILPFIKEVDVFKEDVFKKFGIEIWYHRSIPPYGNSYVCPLKMLNKKVAVCPYCEKYFELEDWEEKKVYKLSLRGAVWVLDVSTEEEKAKGVQLWLFGNAKETFSAIWESFIDPETKKVHNIFKEPRVIYFKGEESGEGQFKHIKIVTPRLGSKVYPRSVIEQYFDQIKPFSEILAFAEKEDDVVVEEDKEIDLVEELESTDDVDDVPF